MPDTPKKPPKPAAKKKPSARLPQATLKHPTIEAILGGHFRFATKEQALARLKGVRESFSVSKLPETWKNTPPEVRLWIRGYGMTAEAREAGYLGNFAQLRVARASEEKWTIEAVLLNIDKKFHPQRRQTAQKFPNWGHPILRDVLAGRVHKTMETAQDELRRLHEAFPEVSIPLATKMYIMIYRKAGTESTSPVEKWVLDIQVRGVGFVIVHARNTHRAAVPGSTHSETNGAGADAASAPAEAQGKFTAQVLFKRRGRKPRPVRKPVAGEGE